VSPITFGAMFPVALGFECPLFVPLNLQPEALTTARSGEGSRPWSAGAGCGALATGLVQVAWILRKIRQELQAPTPLVFLNGQLLLKVKAASALGSAIPSL
jgi:hypothetical protein